MLVRYSWFPPNHLDTPTVGGHKGTLQQSMFQLWIVNAHNWRTHHDEGIKAKGTKRRMMLLLYIFSRQLLTWITYAGGFCNTPILHFKCGQSLSIARKKKSLYFSTGSNTHIASLQKAHFQFNHAIFYLTRSWQISVLSGFRNTSKAPD